MSNEKVILAFLEGKEAHTPTREVGTYYLTFTYKGQTLKTDGKELILYILPDGKIPVRAEGELDGEPFTLDFTEFEYLPSPETE